MSTETSTNGRLIDGRQILAALRAVGQGDFSTRLPLDWTGTAGEVAMAFNYALDLLDRSTAEVARVSDVVGKQGKISQRATVPGAGGGWAVRVDSLNNLINDLVWPTAAVSRVIGAVAKGNLSEHVDLEIDGSPLEGEFLRLGQTVNTMVDQLDSFASEVTRVAREVGTEGRLGGQADVTGACGIWKELGNHINLMVQNVTSQVRETSEVTAAVARGDLTKRYVGVARGEFLEMKNVLNAKEDLLSSVASEVTRVAREVGTEGKLGGQADVTGACGIWKELGDHINLMVQNVTSQVRETREVTAAVARGDLTKRYIGEARGEFLDMKNVLNAKVDLLSSVASELTRVAREVGSDGKLGGQADVRGTSGTWKELGDHINLMVQNVTSQVRETREVTAAVARGDLTKRYIGEARGEFLDMKNVLNAKVNMLNSVASELTRLAREVGTEGKLGGQAVVKDVAGVWKELTDSVNTVAGNLTVQLRDVSKVATAIARGDLSQKITIDVKGEILEVKNTINTMMDQLNSFASEVTRVAREVGTEGKLGGQAVVAGVAGTWKDLTDNVNAMAGNLTVQLRDVSKVATAIARGDLGQKITVDVRGEILQIKDAINTMMDQLRSFASEVTRVAREVGTEGRLGGQAVVPGVAGVWKDLTDNVNAMAGNLTVQLRDVSKVATAIAKGDLGQKITVDVRGEILQIKDAINTMMDQLNSFASEVTRVAREVGTEGKLGGQAVVAGVAGTWKDLTDNVNAMAGNLTVQLRDVSKVATAIAKGDLGQKITVDVRGEILQIKDAINTMMDQLNSFASEVTRVAREVGTEGKLGGQAMVPGVAGTWKDLTDNVNAMAGNLTVQLRDVSKVATAIARGDLGQKITVDVRGEILQIKDAINTMMDQLRSFASEVTRVAREVGTEGKLGGQAVVPGVAGTWKDLTDNVNAMAGNLTVQLRDVSKVATAIARGDLGQKITVDVRGEILQIKDAINTMMDQLNSFASEVTRVAREVGTEGKLGGQAIVPGVAGTWKDLTDSVNAMAGNLTVQLRDVSKVATAIAKGDLGQKITVDVKGEILQIKDTFNSMIDTLALFAEQVTGVAREVGVEGKLGGQADVPGAAGTWKNLTDNVNELAANLSSQVRAIAEVATSVTKGDLTRSITVEARGEVADLKDNVNQMIGNLRDTTKKNTEQDWLKTNLAKFTRVLQGQREMVAVAKLILNELAPLVSAQHGIFYIMDKEGDKPVFKLMASYAYQWRKGLNNRFKLGQGLVGQCALEKNRIVITDVPSHYIRISSGLGHGRPRNVAVIPIIFEGEVKAVIELASFNRFTDIHLTFLEQLTEGIGIVLNTISAGMRTEELLKQSQSLAQELQSQQAELQDKNTRLEQQTASLRQSEELLRKQQDQLQRNNEELGEKARLLATQKEEVENKNRQIELARTAVQEKAEQLALTSKYKSEFLANMSHELRTPLNSLLILSKLLTDNSEGNLQPNQVEYARTIHSSGCDLLTLINDILDMAKIESGTVAVEPAELLFEEVHADLERNFRQVAQQKGLAFEVELDPKLPRAIYTDGKRLLQVLKNLLSNACKFTQKGRVGVTIAAASSGWSIDHPVLSQADKVIAFHVADTGIGIARNMLKVIFEPFHQGDGSTSRKYGGTGLGLSISREIARLLGGEISVESTLSKGSIFTLLLPQVFLNPWQLPPRPISLFAPSTRRIDKPADPDDWPGAETTATLPSPRERRESHVGEPEQPDPGTGDSASSLVRGDRVLLIIDDDPAFAGILLTLARERGLKGLVAKDGRTGLALARKHHPLAITLDLLMPDMDGWAILDQLKHDPATAHIPVQVLTVVGDDRHRALNQGALAVVAKPANRETLQNAIRRLVEFADRQVKELLVIEDKEPERRAIVELIGNKDVKTTAVGTSTEALEALQSGTFDCVVLDPTSPDRSGFELLRLVQEDSRLRAIPVLIYAPKPLTTQERGELSLLQGTITLKDTHSMDSLFAESALFLHRPENDLPEAKRSILRRVRAGDNRLPATKVLIVDDDARNVLALSAVLDQHGLEVVLAEDGKTALEILQTTPGIDLVLMDIMMPDMDGFETTRRLRRLPQFKDLPVIALTAKAMKGNREKCLEAGCSDYVAKPVDNDQLVSLLRVWLSR